ncbi:uncharacterized protein N7484_007628 [Penicillium longicatenatum]|uniref:uncharacterized protein n=1 Tax=Penicillium longicatenatum TaxID=1561947 RepID=UPI002547DC72|nr:uncharacterized protein N7484_007628 [Penicillium longicatenatum]KAJ5639766.1 hypothetical protein N7484_007628 [Penicillium longicatenatum]
MIPHSSAGGQPWGHPMRPLNGGPGRVDLAQMSSQYDPSSVTSQPPLPLSQPPARPSAVVDLTNNGYDTNDKEPPPKRPRLDISGVSKVSDAGSSVKGADARGTPASASSRPQLSWRGRPMWSFQAVMSEIPGSATGSRPTSPPPFPTQPWSNVPLDDGSRSREASPDKKVQTVPFRIVTPSVAPAIKGEKVADFTPWTGNHPEDVLNEQAAKQGYYSRTQVSQNESNTARPALYGQLKHRTGLQMLSTVFSAALEKRQNHNTVHAPSSFKPPPRVTLTDNKREAWLRDLANPSVPLRRLSRTIPHGIRGKVLLDQCLGKWIPVARAVWLAKCVGANEIRAFKRKGTSGALAVGLEAKWVRDWTTNVQQFVETVFNAPKSSDWKPKMTYAIGLTARLFFENLLDHDHFIEWFLSSFEAASIGTVPVWLMMLGIYWNSITRYRRRGRRLAELLLEKLRQATETKREPLKPLIDRLSRFMKKLIQEHTSSLLLPNSWEKYKSQVISCLDLTDNVDRALLQNLTERNFRVQRPRHPKQTPQRSPNQRVIRLLDSILSEYDINAVSTACLGVVEDRTVLVSKLLEWLSTPFRHGIYRVYAGARLLRKWKAAGVDVDDHILSFLARAGRNQKLNMENVYHTISELVRSQTFSVGRYLQWLMAKDVTSHASSYRQSMPDSQTDIALIAQLPVGRLPEHVGNLRSTLLARIGFSAADEINMLANIKQLISQRLPGIFDMESHNDMTLDSSSINLTWAVKAEIGQWLRRGVAQHTSEATSSANRASILVGGSQSVSMLTPDEFQIVRDILETFEDLSMLADVLKYASSSQNSVVLASVADTTNYHFDSLCMIGATSDLFRKLVDAYTIIKRFNTPSLDLLYSLIELGLRIPHECNTVLILRQDLSRIGNKAILAASSPVSDHIPESFGNADPLFREKLDHLLLSGNLMDEPTLDTIFNTLTKQLESQLGKGKLSANDTCQYLAQLRSFQPKHFDGMLIRWVCAHLRSSDRSTLLSVIPSLIGVGCVTISSFLSLVRRLNYSTTPLPNAGDLPAELVDILLSAPAEDRYLDLFSPPAEDRYLDLVSYRFHLSQQKFLAKSFDEVLSIVCDAASSLDIGDVRKRNDREASLVALLRELLVRNPGCVEQSCMKKLVDQYPNAIGPLRKALDSLLGVDLQKETSSVISQVEKLASTTDDFSLPFCQLKLQILFHQDSDNEDRNSIADAMFKTVVTNSRAQNFHWVDLVALMSPDAVRQIRERAEKEFFSIPVLEELPSSSSATPYGSGSLETAKLYLTIIEELAGSTPDAATSAIVSVLVDKMDGLLQKVLSMQGDDRNGSTPNPARPNFERSLAFWFSALLRMVVIHRASFMLPSGLKVNASHEPSRLLVSIFCIALSRLPADVLRLFPGADYFPRPGSSEDYRPCPGILLQTHALDVAASLIDVFPDETRHQCSRFLREKCPTLGLQSDARFLYLLGPMADSTTSHLQSTAAQSPAAGSTPTSNLPATAHSSQPNATHLGAHFGVGEGLNFAASRLRLQQRGRTVGPYPNRPWELLEDAAPFVGVNDTAVNLAYFDARRIRL